MVYQCYLPVHTVMEDWQTSGISGDKRSTVEASFCFVGISTGVFAWICVQGNNSGTVPQILWYMGSERRIGNHCKGHFC